MRYRNFLLYWFPPIALMVAVYHYSTIPISIPTCVKHQDKYIHFLTYGFLSYLWMRAFFQTEKEIWFSRIISACIPGFFGMLVEVCQIYCNRYFEFADIFANWTGAILGVILYHLLRIFWQKTFFLFARAFRGKQI